MVTGICPERPAFDKHAASRSPPNSHPCPFLRLILRRAPKESSPFGQTTDEDQELFASNVAHQSMCRSRVEPCGNWFMA
jgi:hypothetical protein